MVAYMYILTTPSRVLFAAKTREGVEKYLRSLVLQLTGSEVAADTAVGDGRAFEMVILAVPRPAETVPPKRRIQSEWQRSNCPPPICPTSP